MRYSVHLRDSGFDASAREAAEERYRNKLQRMIGSDQEVVESYMQWSDLVESDQTATDADRTFGRFWEAVVKESVAAGFKGQDLPEGFEGFFEIRVTR